MMLQLLQLSAIVVGSCFIGSIFGFPTAIGIGLIAWAIMPRA